MSGAPNSHDEHDLDLPSDNVWEIAPAAAPGINPKQIAPSEDGWMDPATEATHSSALELNTDPTSYEAGVIGPSNSSLATGSEPCRSVPIKSDWAPIMEFTSADIFQHFPLGDVLNSLNLSPCQETLGWTMYGSSGKRMTKKLVPHPPPT